MDARLKVWQRLGNEAATYHIDAVEIRESNIFAPQRIEFPRYCALVGSHGTGKTSLLRLIHFAMGERLGGYLPPFGKGDLSGDHQLAMEGLVAVSIQTPSGTFVREVDIGAPPADRAPVWDDVLGPEYESDYTSVLTAFSDMQFLWQEWTFAERKNSQLIYSYTAKELEALRAILGRHYDRASVTAAIVDQDQESGWTAYAPLVKADIGDLRLNSATMSLGEIWVHYMLGYAMRQHPHQSTQLTLLDEPESLLASRGQRPFIDEVARLALAGKRQLLIATHSAEIFSRFPLDHVLMCVPGKDGIRVVQPTSVQQVRTSVGLQSSLRGVILVEDEGAVALLSCLFSILRPGVNGDLDVIAAGGETKVVAAAGVLGLSSRLTVAGILDGDSRKRYSQESGVLFFPGLRAPESELLSTCLEKSDVVATSVGCPEGDVLAAVASTVDVPHQVQIRVFAEALNLDVRTALRMLVIVWLQDADVLSQAEQLLAAIVTN